MCYGVYSESIVEKSEIKKKVMEEEDFVHAPKHQNSLRKFITKMENPLENGAIGRLLMLSPEEVEEIYQESVEKLKKEMASE